MALVSGTSTYADIAYADAYINGRLHAQGDWGSLSDDEKESALTLAMLHLDSTYQYKGVLADKTQLVNWPRTSAYDDQGRAFDKLVIPAAVKNAQCELAIMWAANDQLTPPAEFFTMDDTATTINQVKMEKLGDLQREYYKNDDMMWKLQQGYMNAKVYPMLDIMLKPYCSRLPSDIFAELQLY